MADVALLLGMLLRVSVHFARRRLKDLGALSFAKLEHFKGAEHIRAHRAHGIFLIMNGRGRAGEIIDLIDIRLKGLAHIARL